MMIRSIALVAGAAFTLGACDVAETFGIGREGPDEFAVLRHAPLSVPPDFRLRPPEPGAVRPQEQPRRESARQTLTGAGGSGGAAKSAGETALLSKMGGAKVDSSFRRRIDEETAEIARKNRRLLDDLIFWGRSRDACDRRRCPGGEQAAARERGPGQAAHRGRDADHPAPVGRRDVDGAGRPPLPAGPFALFRHHRDRRFRARARRDGRGAGRTAPRL